jgi:hypothetical protein
MTATATPITNIAVTRGRFAWHELLTTDPAAAQTFYQQVIGWTSAKWEGSTMEYTMWMAGETAIGGVLQLPAEAAAMATPPSWLAYIEVPDADAAIEQAVKLGGTVLAPARTVEQVGRFAVLSDPQGAVFAIIANATPLPPEKEPATLEFCWHELTTTDLPAGTNFYSEMFGWEPVRGFDMGEGKGIYHVFGRGPFTYGGMMKKPDDMPVPPAMRSTSDVGSHWLHYIEVESADAATERAVNAGATVLLDPIDVPSGTRIAILTDPQGAAFAVHSKPQAH